MNIQERTNKAGRRVFQAQVITGKTTDPATGKTLYARESATFDSKKEAERWSKERTAKAEEDRKAYLQPTRESLAAFLERWLEGRKEDLRPTSWWTYDRMIRCHITPAIGSLPLIDLPGATATIERMLGEVGRKVSPQTAGAAKKVLVAALTDAVRLGLLPFNPASRAKGPKQNPRKVVAFTQEELDAIFLAANGSRLEHLLPFLAHSGLRRGEALALRWDDLDAAKGILNVGRNLVPVTGDRHHLQEPKTEAGKRTITLPAHALEALRAQKELQRQDKLACLQAGKPFRNDGFIFTTENGGLYDPGKVTKGFGKLRRIAGVSNLPLHGLRHTAVSLQVAAGIPLEIISKRIGHKKSGFTMDLYAHLLPQMDRDAVDKLDAYLARKN